MYYIYRMRNQPYQKLKAVVKLLLFFGALILVMKFVGDRERHTSSAETATSSSSHISNDEAIDNYKRNRYGDPVITICTFCGGIGKVGYAGESEAQIKRTGNGLGNICNVCKGAGKIKKYSN